MINKLKIAWIKLKIIVLKDILLKLSKWVFKRMQISDKQRLNNLEHETQNLNRRMKSLEEETMRSVGQLVFALGLEIKRDSNNINAVKIGVPLENSNNKGLLTILFRKIIELEGERASIVDCDGQPIYKGFGSLKR